MDTPTTPRRKWDDPYTQEDAEHHLTQCIKDTARASETLQKIVAKNQTTYLGSIKKLINEVLELKAQLVKKLKKPLDKPKNL